MFALKGIINETYISKFIGTIKRNAFDIVVAKAYFAIKTQINNHHVKNEHRRTSQLNST